MPTFKTPLAHFILGTRTRNALIAVAGALVLTATAPASAADGEEPFNGSFSGSMAWSSPTTLAWTGAGQASGLGISQNTADVLLEPGVPTPCANGVANINTETLIAANGDTLVIRMNDVACPVSPTVLHGTGHWDVVGGTGRFAGMSGHGTSEGNGDFAAGTFEFTLTGTLSHPN